MYQVWASSYFIIVERVRCKGVVMAFSEGRGGAEKGIREAA
jgi:hypothetical protein